jgi:hypothetical protein
MKTNPAAVGKSIKYAITWRFTSVARFAILARMSARKVPC